MTAAAERLAAARALADCDSFDVSAALALLNTMPDTIGPTARDLVEHAKRVVSAAPGGDYRHQAVARYAIARVIVFLERDARDATAPPA